MRYLYDIFWEIPQLLVQDFQIILNFLYVSQSVSWLTFLLKLDIYRDISSSWWEIFLIWETFLGFCYNSSNVFWISRTSVCWPTSLLKGPSFGNSKEQRGLQDKPLGPMDYHYSPPPTSPIISSAFALLANLELYILVPLLINLLIY